MQVTNSVLQTYKDRIVQLLIMTSRSVGCPRFYGPYLRWTLLLSTGLFVNQRGARHRNERMSVTLAYYLCTYNFIMLTGLTKSIYPLVYFVTNYTNLFLNNNVCNFLFQHLDTPCIVLKLQFSCFGLIIAHVKLKAGSKITTLHHPPSRELIPKCPPIYL